MKNIMNTQYKVWHNLCLAIGEIRNESELSVVNKRIFMQVHIIAVTLVVSDIPLGTFVCTP